MDWLAFADAWRGEYQPTMELVRSGQIPFSKLYVLHRHNLDRILPRFGIKGVTEDRLRDLNLAWHRLDAWPAGPRASAPPIPLGGRVERKHFADDRSRTAQRAPWDAILGAEIAGDYKPKPRVYLSACEAFDLPPEQCMMVAAHSNDLGAAAACGLRTAHVARPNEKGPGKSETAPSLPVDVAARDLEDLARKLLLTSSEGALSARLER